MTKWHERDLKTGHQGAVGSERNQELEEAKGQSLPPLLKESSGIRPFEQIRFQPVRAHGLFDAEFAVKAKDIIFHFWPYDYHKAQAEMWTKDPTFPKGFPDKLHESMKKSFAANRVETTYDQEMGAYFVKAIGYGEGMSPFVLATDVCRELYRLLGGEG